jgi:hypothetical protein
MNATTATTARELYECDPDFRALVGVWVEHRRCPLPLVDLLLGYGFESQAEAARWAATEPDKEAFSAGGVVVIAHKCGPFPWHIGERWIFRTDPSHFEYSQTRAHRVPHFRLRGVVNDIGEVTLGGSNAADAILLLLDAWVTP